jgi:hypothetical protein
LLVSAASASPLGLHQHKVNVQFPTLSVEVETEHDTALTLPVEGGEWATSRRVYSILEEPSGPCFLDSLSGRVWVVKMSFPWKESNPDSFVLQPVT